MLRREIQRRLYHAITRIERRFEEMQVASQEPREFIRVLLKGAQIQLVGIGLFFTIIFGTSGYLIIEDWTLVDSFYMTVITLTTVGFGEVDPLSQEGRVFTIFLILLGVSLVTYGVSNAIEYVATGEVTRQLKQRHRWEKLKNMQQHFIIVGFGRVGREVAMAFHDEEIPFVVIDSSEDVLEKAEEFGYVTMLGTGSEDAILIEAGIEKAAGLVACAGNDATNVYVVLQHAD